MENECGRETGSPRGQPCASRLLEEIKRGMSVMGDQLLLGTSPALANRWGKSEECNMKECKVRPAPLGDQPGVKGRKGEGGRVKEGSVKRGG